MQRLKMVFRIAAVIVTAAFISSVSFGADDATPMTIRADRLHIERNKKTATFEGNVRFSVRLSVEKVSIECERMVVHYAENGAIGNAEIEGNVVITQSGATASAARAELNMKTGTVILLGSPRFTRGKNTLLGKRIRINIRTGEVDVFEPSGTFMFVQENH